MRIGDAALALGVAILGFALLASATLLPPRRTIDKMAIVDLDAAPKDDVRFAAYSPDRLRWTVGRGLGLAYHAKGSNAWFAVPLAIAEPGEDLPRFSLRASDVHPVSIGRIHAPTEEAVWLSSGGRSVGSLVVAPDALLRFASNDRSQRLSGQYALADGVRR